MRWCTEQQQRQKSRQRFSLCFDDDSSSLCAQRSNRENTPFSFIYIFIFIHSFFLCVLECCRCCCYSYITKSFVWSFFLLQFLLFLCIFYSYALSFFSIIFVLVFSFFFLLSCICSYVIVVWVCFFNRNLSVYVSLTYEMRTIDRGFLLFL